MKNSINEMIQYKSIFKNFAILSVFVIINSCSSNLDKNENNDSNKVELPNDVRWITNSSEYKTLSRQIYKNAWDNLSNIIMQSNQTSCIVMDLDETVLDNSKYQIELTVKNESYNPDSWSEWVNLKEAKLVPGSKSFIDNVRQSKIKIIFLSNRMAKNELPTIENMKTLEIFNSDDIFLLRKDKNDKKHLRRSEIINGTGRMKSYGPLKILAYFGDAAHDFPKQDKYYLFGKNMYMFPNPMYGKW